MAFLISAEVFPLVNREMGMSFAVRLAPPNSIESSHPPGLLQFYRCRSHFPCCANSYPRHETLERVHHVLVRGSPSHSLTFLIHHSGLNLCCWVACYLLVPQTQGRSIDMIFQRRRLHLSSHVCAEDLTGNRRTIYSRDRNKAIRGTFGSVTPQKDERDARKSFMNAEE